MATETETHPQSVARWTGLALLASIIVGIGVSMFISSGIDVNLSGDPLGTAENMLDAESRLRAKAYFGLLAFALQALVGIGLFLLLRAHGLLTAWWSLVANIVAGAIVLLGAVYAMNAAGLVSHADYTGVLEGNQQMVQLTAQILADHTSFHLGLVLSTASNVGFFYLFLKSGLMPRLLAGWGLFASVFVVTAIIARDFIPALGANAVTYAFMLSNMVALVGTGLYLAIRGVRTPLAALGQ